MAETGGVKFGLSYNTGFPGTAPANLKAIARHADDLGFGSFYLPGHVRLYPGARVGEVEFAPDLPIADLSSGPSGMCALDARRSRERK